MLLYFLLGIIFIEWIFPITENISVLIQTFIEMLKGKMSVKIAKFNSNIKEINKSYSTENIRQIGFTIPDDTEEEDEYDDDDNEI